MNFTEELGEEIEAHHNAELTEEMSRSLGMMPKNHPFRELAETLFRSAFLLGVVAEMDNPFPSKQTSQPVTGKN